MARKNGWPVTVLPMDHLNIEEVFADIRKNLPELSMDADNSGTA
jgi:hypothetical protein